MKSIFSLLFFFFFAFMMDAGLYATHNRAGEITFHWISGYNYEITVTTYTRTSSCQADRCEVEINFGDNSLSENIKRTNGAACSSAPFCGDSSCDHCGELYSGNPDIKINIYRTEHIYPGPGIYRISVDDPNRNEGVVNVPNSVNTSFYIESELYISPFGGINNSPVLDFPPIDVACAEILFEHNPGAYDPDGDVLVFSIVPNRGAAGGSISNYSFPDAVPGCAASDMSIHPSSGLLTWNTPKCCDMSNPLTEHNEFNVAILIEEFRNGQKIGSVLRDMQIEVECECPNDPPFIVAASQLCVFAGDTIDTLITASDPNPGDSLKLTASGEPLSLVNSPATFLLPAKGIAPVSSAFRWNTNCGHVRSNPYTVTFRVEDNHPHVPLVDYHSLEIKVVAPRVNNPVAAPQGNNILLTWEPSFCYADGYKVYRRIDSSGFPVDSCQPGLPSGTGYELIAGCSSVSSNSFTDTDKGQGLVHGQKYCYVIVACMPGGSENIVSEEFCAELKNDVPVITNVSVFVTDVLNGSDSVIWAMPKELDTLQYGAPYHYNIYRQEGLGMATVLSGSTNASNFLALTDTFFVDSQDINTKEKPYTYKVELISNGTSVGNTQNASSVFLSSAPTDNALNLSWEEHVPWANKSYFIYKKNSSGIFEFLDSSALSFYKDTGLVNGEEYCYFVQSKGTYSSPGITDPLLNNSQIHCNKPYDNVPPCRPDTLLLQADCNLSQNTLTWNNPNNDCADDVVGYKVYYTPVLGGELSLIEEISSSSDTDFLNKSNVSIAGCYAISALDTNLNESPLSDSACADNCPEYELPNVFTPGGDGKNDFFHPLPYKFIAKINIQIFNRWGQLVYETDDPDIRWDGRHSKTKKMCPSGVYYYVCQVHEIRLSGIETKILKGYVHMLYENGDGIPPGK